MTRRQDLADLLRTSSTSLRSRPARTIGMSLPVMIGVAMIIVSFGIAASARADFTDSLRRLGANHLLVVPSMSDAGDVVAKLPPDATARAERLPAVVAVGALSEQRRRVVLPSSVADPLSAASTSATVYATGAGLLSAVDGSVAAGRFLNEFDGGSRAEVVVLGAELARSFGIDRPGQRSVLIDGKPHGIVGVLNPVSVLPQMDWAVLVPTSTATRYWGDDDRASLLVVKVLDGAAGPSAKALPRLVTYGDGPAPNVQIASDLVKARAEIGETFGVLVAASGGLALLLGTLGIGFAMSAAILQRTSEIGLRRALGASRREIAAQFLTEAAVVGALGGAVGVVLGCGIVVVVAGLRSWPVVADPLLAAASYVLAVQLALIAGLLPARRAALLDPMAALRT